jgi:hypothetical protein
MTNEGGPVGELHFLLGLVDPGDAERARQRLGIGARPAVDRSGLRLSRHPMPASILLWMLEQDDPELNEQVYFHQNVTLTIRRDIRTGVSYGEGPLGRKPVKVSPKVLRSAGPEIPATAGPYGLIGTLRRADTMRRGRAAAVAVGRHDWPAVAEADQEQPLPGYARWALATRIDCPPALRAQFGSHPKFDHRLRAAGIIEGPHEYVSSWRPALNVLSVLGVGLWAFPNRAAEAAASLRPLVRAELGGHTEAWAVLAQLLPSFTGTLPELIATSGAIAGEPVGPLSVPSDTTDGQGEYGTDGGRSWDTASGTGGFPSSTSPTAGRSSAGGRRTRTWWRPRSG